MRGTIFLCLPLLICGCAVTSTSEVGEVYQCIFGEEAPPDVLLLRGKHVTYYLAVFLRFERPDWEMEVVVPPEWTEEFYRDKLREVSYQEEVKRIQDWFSPWFTPDARDQLPPNVHGLRLLAFRREGNLADNAFAVHYGLEIALYLVDDLSHVVYVLGAEV